MISRYSMVFLLGLFSLLLVGGCGEDPPPAPKASAVRQKVDTQKIQKKQTEKASPPASQSSVVRQKVETGEDGQGQTGESPGVEAATESRRYSYNPAGKRDPFQSVMERERLSRTPPEEKTPLQRYSLNQLRIIAVIWGKGEPQAMVVGPDGKSHILRKGVKVGQNDGVVTDITREEVLVEERIYDFGGTSRIVTQKIPLPITKKELI